MLLVYSITYFCKKPKLFLRAHLGAPSMQQRMAKCNAGRRRFLGARSDPVAPHTALPPAVCSSMCGTPVPPTYPFAGACADRSGALARPRPGCALSWHYLLSNDVAFDSAAARVERAGQTFSISILANVVYREMNHSIIPYDGDFVFKAYYVVVQLVSESLLILQACRHLRALT